MLSHICEAQVKFQRLIKPSGFFGARSLIQTTDGGYAAAGYTDSSSAGYYDFHIVKLNANGLLQWTRTVGGTTDDKAYSIVQSTDGGYLVAGTTSNTYATIVNVYIVKLNSSGVVQWSKTLAASNSDNAFSVVCTRDGGYALGGSTFAGAGSGDFYIVKIDANGNFLWANAFDVSGGLSDCAYSLIQTSDNGFALAGYSFNTIDGKDDFCVLKLDSIGTFKWCRIISPGVDSYAQSIIQTTDNGYAVAGYTVYSGPGDMFIAKLDQSGTLQWSKTVGGTSYDRAYSIVQTSDGGYVSAGYTQSFASIGVIDCYFVKLNSSGSLLWSKNAGTTVTDYTYSLIKTSDGGFAAGGTSSVNGYGMYIIKFDSDWNTCGSIASNTSSAGTYNVAITKYPTNISPSVTVTTKTYSSNTGGALTTFCSSVGINNQGEGNPRQYNLFQNYPDPFNPSTKINYEMPKDGNVKISVFDILGKETETLVNEEKKAGRYTVEFNGTQYASGIYFYRIQVDEGKGYTAVKKMVLLK